MLTPNPQAQARSGVSTALSNARSSVQRNPTIISTLLYLLTVVAIFAVVGLGAAYSPWSYKLTFFLVQLVALLLGWAHVRAMPRWLTWYDPEATWHGPLLTLLTWLAASLGLAASSWVPWFTPATPSLAFVTAAIPVAVPYFFLASYQAWRQIPVKQYKLWYYQPSAAGPDLSRMDLSNFMVIHFWMSRRYGESLFHDFSSKAPYEMRFSDLFHIFLTDYNLIKPEQAIQYLDNDGHSYGWIFYAKQPWWKPRRYYDPDYTFRDNFIKQGNIIVAKRVAVQS
ncbi:TssN family type VI secretion system protein [Hymenobacter chitinivorans]|uniref:Uncharacterized protein n=1 Tax=Hymenobacter chitinivorans DSM 11115 TaxID=1121954 RepID=A0A2M9BN16_9BACT|nr:TssN family type VI secretion system protein [Hymenobacter chitinivorans]PJJ59351.1 hypothetical protein CLV45_0768 [Hymenobacter chitinivorans DSM 11115]